MEGEALAREVLRRTALREYSKAASLLGSPGMAAPTAAVEAKLEELLEKSRLRGGRQRGEEGRDRESLGSTSGRL